MKRLRHGFGHILKEYRIRKNLSQKELGAIVGKDQKDLTRYETGKVLPPREVILALCKHLGLQDDVYFSDLREYSVADVVSDSIKKKYSDIQLEELSELFNLIQKEKEFVAVTGLTGYLKRIPKMSSKEKKQNIKFLKIFFKTKIKEK